MNRRQFINHSTKLAGSALIATQIPGCLKYDDLFYPGLSNGKSWTNHQATNLPTGSNGPTVIKDNGTYKMWYVTTGSSVYYATSSDGINWTQHGIVLQYGGSILSTGFFNPCVLKDNGVYKIWFQDGGNISYCESSDGINWSNNNLSIITGGGSPCVMKVGSFYRLWYANTPVIYYADSSDGINWSNNQACISAVSYPGYTESSQGEPCLIKDSGIYKLWYIGASTAADSNIIYAESSDGINWSNLILAHTTASSGIKASHPCIVNDYGVGKMWYYNINTNSIWYAESY